MLRRSATADPLLFENGRDFPFYPIQLYERKQRCLFCCHDSHRDSQLCQYRPEIGPYMTRLTMVEPQVMLIRVLVSSRLVDTVEITVVVVNALLTPFADALRPMPHH